MWLPGLVRHEPVSGICGQLGSASNIVLRQGAEELEGTETIIEKEPSELAGISGETNLIIVRELGIDVRSRKS